MMYEINYAYTSHIGRVRANNEDNFWCCGESLPVQNYGTSGVFTGTAVQKTLPALAVFDGMGGESCGEIAAGIAAQEFGKYYNGHKEELKKSPEKFLENICVSMNQQVVLYGEENRIHSMGTTAAMTVFSRKGIYVGNLGDSRIYHSNGNKLRQVSVDHVIGRSMFGKAPLTQYLGMMEKDFLLEPCISRMEYIPGSRYLLCSDGMTDMLSDGEIADILTREISVSETVEVLLERVLQKGARDNITIVLCEISETKKHFLDRWIKHTGIEKSEGEIS